MKDASITTEALYQGTDVRGMDLHPEAIPTGRRWARSFPVWRAAKLP